MLKCFEKNGVITLSKPFVFEKPLGMRDVLPETVRKKQYILDRIEQVIQKWGYDKIETPTLEYYDTVGGVSSTIEQRMFKLLDRTGRTVVLRPDLTAPIARVVASLLVDRAFPIRLSYQGNVFRAQEKEAGRNAEFPELGVELIGEQAPDADAEVIALAIESIKEAGVEPFKLTIGHIGLLNAFLHDALNNEEHEKKLKQYLQHKNMVGYRQYIDRADLSHEQREQLLSLLTWRGGMEQIVRAMDVVQGSNTLQYLEGLRELWGVLKLHGVHEYVLFDLSLISHMDYYTGIFFEGYANRLGFPISSGGRYDHLLAQFGRPAPAIGFTLKVDRLLEASQLPLPDPSYKVLLTYTEQERQEAFEQAKQLRSSGKQVTLHRVSLKHDVSNHEQTYDQWIRLDQREVNHEFNKQNR